MKEVTGGALPAQAWHEFMPADDGTTASVGHPVPPGNVGGPLKKRKQTSILDILGGG